MLRALGAITQLCYSRVLKRNIEEKWVKYKHRKWKKEFLPSAMKSNSWTTASQTFWTTFFSLWGLWLLLPYKQGYFWTVTARSSAFTRVKELFLFLELLLFCFCIFSQVFFYLVLPSYLQKNSFFIQKWFF